jgi:hypothetical protein
LYCLYRRSRHLTGARWLCRPRRRSYRSLNRRLFRTGLYLLLNRPFFLTRLMMPLNRRHFPARRRLSLSRRFFLARLMMALDRRFFLASLMMALDRRLILARFVVALNGARRCLSYWRLLVGWPNPLACLKMLVAGCPLARRPLGLGRHLFDLPLDRGRRNHRRHLVRPRRFPLHRFDRHALFLAPRLYSLLAGRLLPGRRGFWRRLDRHWPGPHLGLLGRNINNLRIPFARLAHHPPLHLFLGLRRFWRQRLALCLQLGLVAVHHRLQPVPVLIGYRRRSVAPDF